MATINIVTKGFYFNYSLVTTNIKHVNVVTNAASFLNFSLVTTASKNISFITTKKFTYYLITKNEEPKNINFTTSNGFAFPLVTKPVKDINNFIVTISAKNITLSTISYNIKQSDGKPKFYYPYIKK